jgi:hypothetical protein
MSRRRPSPASPKLSPIEAGLSLLALDILRRLDVACPADAEVLGLLGVSAKAGDDLEEHSYELKSLVLDRLIDGLLSKLPVAPTAP